MALSDHLNKPRKSRHGMPCSVAVVLSKLAPKERAILQAALDDPSYKSPQIFKALVAEGHSVGAQTIGRHRAESCRCYSEAAA